MRRAALIAVLAALALSCARKAPPAPPTPPPAPADAPGALAGPTEELDPREVLPLLRALGGPEDDVAYDRLVRSDQAALDALGEILLHGRPADVDKALVVLADHLLPRARVVVRDLARGNAEPWRRARALETLAEGRFHPGVDFLRPLGPLLDPAADAALRLKALDLFARHPAPPLAGRLVALLAQEDAPSAAGARRALEALAARDPDSADALARRIDGVQPDAARLALAEILGSAGAVGRRPMVALLASADAAVRAGAVRALRGSDPRGPRPPALYRALLDPDPSVRGAALDLFRSEGRKGDVPEIAPLLEDPACDAATTAALGALLDALAGTNFGADPEKFRQWSWDWMTGAVEPFGDPDPLQALPLELGLEAPRPFPWTATLVLLGVTVLAGAGLAAASRRPEPAPGADAQGGDGESFARPSPAGRIGKWIFDHRILVLFPWFVPPLLLFDAAALPALPWRLALYGVVALGAALRLWCTGYRTWAYRSSGPRHLMTAGPYSVVRHPIYVANFLLAAPLFVAVDPWPLAALFCAWYVLTHFAIILREDEILKERYGAEWVRYAAAIGRVLPLPRIYPDRRGEFSVEPILKGQEIPKAAAIVALLPLAVELLAPWWDAAAAWTRAHLGL